VGRFPGTLDDLTQQPAGLNRIQWGGPYLEQAAPNDPWGNPYLYVADEQHDRVLIKSFGPDGMDGTADDIPNK
jgi:general secretion pathway protein G